MQDEYDAFHAINTIFNERRAEAQLEQRFRYIIWTMGVLSAGAGIAALLLISGPVQAHEAHSGMPYPAICCNGNAKGGDCQAISSKAVRSIPGGYRVTLRPGDHWMVTREHVFDVPEARTRDSEDGQFHICLYPDENNNQCFFAPPPGA